MGVPLGFHLMVEYILQGVPHCDFIGLHYILQELLLKLTLDVHILCEEAPSGIQRASIFVAMGSP